MTDYVFKKAVNTFYILGIIAILIFKISGVLNLSWLFVVVLILSIIVGIKTVELLLDD